jgi:hypothetical protein
MPSDSILELVDLIKSEYRSIIQQVSFDTSFTSFSGELTFPYTGSGRYTSLRDDIVLDNFGSIHIDEDFALRLNFKCKNYDISNRTMTQDLINFCESVEKDIDNQIMNKIKSDNNKKRIDDLQKRMDKLNQKYRVEPIPDPYFTLSFKKGHKINQ